MEKLKYPIGKSKIRQNISNDDIKNWIEIIENHPKKINLLIENLNEEQLDTPYRPEGWTIRQVVHHLGDSHTNSYVRFKWTLTENQPVIKAYFEDRWAELPDTKFVPIQLGLNYLSVLHSKWIYLLKSLTDEDLKKCFIHPESNNKVSLAQNIGLYAWHCEHHYEHINQLMIRKNWK